VIAVPNRSITLIGFLLISAAAAHASVTLLLEEPFGTFGGMNPTGHAAVYLSNVCAATPLTLRRCHQGEQGVVISRYDRVDGYDWIAIPLLPYLYAVDRADQVPSSVSEADVASLRDKYRRSNLQAVAPDQADGTPPSDQWTQLVGSAYYRTSYAFGIETTTAQDDQLIKRFNSRTNRRRFNIFFHNCADFARQTVDSYYPHAIHRSLIADTGIMTPKQAGKSLLNYSKRHRDLQFSIFVVPQVPGSIPRSRPVRGVLESLVKSKRYAVPLVTVAVLHPAVGGGLAFAWLDSSHFNPRRIAEHEDSSSEPAAIADELEWNHVISAAGAAQ
jgi:hypothetical protein